MFETKHLYQSVNVTDSPAMKEAVRCSIANSQPRMSTLMGGGHHAPQPTKEQLEASGQQQFLAVLNCPWIHPVVGHDPNGWLVFTLPQPAVLYCPACDARVAFGPVYGNDLALRWSGKGKTNHEQHFTFGYECQQCRGPERERVVFTVARRGVKLTLCGRAPIETVKAEAYIPKKQAHFYSGAIIARNAGQTLPALFMLRTFVEQFWKSIPAVEAVREETLKKGQRSSGNEMGDAYNDLLPADFRNRFPSLGKVYSNLSAAIHAAKEGEEADVLFATALEQINEHFDARRVFQLT